MFAPALDTLYFAGQGMGAYRFKGTQIEFNLFKLTEISIKLPIPRNDNIFTVAASRSHMSEETMEFIKIKEEEYQNVNLIYNGSSLKICMVAEGTADCYPRFAPTMEWDTSAGHAICRYSGCFLIDQKIKKEMIYNKENLLNNWFIVFRKFKFINPNFI